MNMCSNLLDHIHWNLLKTVQVNMFQGSIEVSGQALRRSPWLPNAPDDERVEGLDQVGLGQHEQLKELGTVWALTDYSLKSRICGWRPSKVKKTWRDRKCRRCYGPRYNLWWCLEGKLDEIREELRYRDAHTWIQSLWLSNLACWAMINTIYRIFN